MGNVREELQKTFKDDNKDINDVIAFSLVLGGGWYSDPIFKKEGQEFSWELIPEDLEYDSGYGSQELFGTILFKDNTWLERGEYDGQEWWEYRSPPTISEIINVNKV